MTITALPSPPSRTDPTNFSSEGDAFLGALPLFVTEANALAVAMNLNDTTATSVTSLAIGTGSKSLTVDVSKSYQPGMSVKIARTASPSNWMHGDVTSYDSGTGALVVNVTVTYGSGTYTDWTITFSAPTLANILPNRNAIINGGMDIWQRGTAELTNPADNTYFPDRFFLGRTTGDGTFNLLQSAETPSVGFPFQYSLKLDCTAIETAVAVGEYANICYRMEGYDFKRFEGETATLSFWVKAVKTGIYCVSFTNNALNKSYVSEFTVNAASTWEKKTITLIFNSGGTFLYTTGSGLQITWAIMCGSTFQIATANKNTWQAGNYMATDAQVNGLDSTDNNFWLTGVQLELGSVATPFEQRPFAQELALCQRYYEKSYAYATAVGTATVAGAFLVATLAGNCTVGDYVYISIPFLTQKNTTPTITFYDSAGTSGKISLVSSNTAITDAIAVAGITSTESKMTLFAASTAVTHRGLLVHYTSVSEL
jgi:hypothetical protein